jgi:RNA polymerase sigma-70 factor (ECF subfamily)
VEELYVTEPAVGGPEETVVAAADAGRLRAAVRGLTDDQAAVVALRFWWNLSINETAEALGKNDNAVKALQHRAIGSLARILRKEGSDEA